MVRKKGDKNKFKRCFHCGFNKNLKSTLTCSKCKRYLLKIKYPKKEKIIPSRFSDVPLDRKRQIFSKLLKGDNTSN